MKLKKILAVGTSMLLMLGLMMPVGAQTTSTTDTLADVSLTTGASTDTSDSDDVDYSEDFESTLDYIMDNYVGSDVTKEELYEAAMQGITDELDPYSVYYTVDEASELTDSLSSNYVGIGVQLQLTNNQPTITKVFSNSPAEDVDVQVGDVISAVEGTSVEGMSLDDIVSLIKGEEGTTVDIEFTRGDTTLDKTVERRQVELSTVEDIDLASLYPSLDEDFLTKVKAYEVSQFASGTDEELTEKVEAAKEDGLEYLILDMRDNGGGYLDTAVNMGRELIPAGIITTLVDKDGNETVYKSYLTDSNVKVVVVVNGNSASATEIFSAAVKDSGVGAVIGETTYGKGVAQTMTALDDGHYLKLTTEEFFSPDGHAINNIGVTPDVVVDMPEYMSGEDRLFVGDQSEEVENLEEILSYLGYFSETPDEDYTNATYNAVYKFQQDNGLYAYGVCDYTTQAMLDSVYLQERQSNDLQMNAAIDWVEEDMGLK